MLTVAELTLDDQPDAVPHARWLARRALDGEVSDDVVADTELVVTELVTNAALHGRPPITVRVLLGGCVRVEVGDAGRFAPVMVGRNVDAMTGRGLSLVAALASDWGIEVLPEGGKLVWVEMERVASVPVPRVEPVIDVGAFLEAWAGDEEVPARYTVHLGRVPTELLLSAKTHVDNVVRELMLIREGDASSDAHIAPEVAAVIETVTVDFADVRAEIKRQAVAAAARGELTTDLELRLPLHAVEAGERYLAALDQVDRFARSAHMLTLASPPVHQIFRRWYVQSLVAGQRALSRSEIPPQARPFEVVLAEEVGLLADRAASSDRLELFQKVTAELTTAGSSIEMAQIAVDNAVRFLGVESARVRLLTDEMTLRSVASAGPAATAGAPYVEYNLDDDLPGALAARERRSVFVRSLEGAFDRDPLLAGRYSAGRSGRVVPLTVGEQLLGLLSLTFVTGELSDDAAVALVDSMADALALALKRAELAASDAEARESLRFLADATQILVTAREPSEVMRRLVRLAVPRLGDWCTVYLADGAVLKRAAVAIRGHEDLAARLQGRVLPISTDVPQTRVFRDGRLLRIQEGVGRLLGSLYPDVDLSSLVGDPDSSSALFVPIELRGSRIGVIALTFLDDRKVTRSLVGALTGLADRAAIAYDIVSRCSAEHDMAQSLVKALLPEEPPGLPGLELAARYLPASGEVAGDWWEAQPMADGTVLVGVGDAAGHGLPAVSHMSQLRHGARALAGVEPSPVRLLDALSQHLESADSSLATAVYGRLRPSDGELVWASAGHVPPMRVRDGGQVEVLERADRPPLGSPATGPCTDERLTLGLGETLVLYTDGVVERPYHSLDEGIARLVATVTAHGSRPIDEVADLIMAEHCREPRDDCCVLVVRRIPF